MMIKNLLFTLTLLFTFTLNSIANNLCTNAVAIIPGTTCNYTMSSFSGSSIAAPLPACGTLASQDVWFSFVATDSTMSVLLQSVSGLNHGFELYTDSCNGAFVLCQNANGSGSNEYYFNNNFHPSKTYYVRVFNASATISTANFGICIQKYPTSANNYCSSAVAITPGTTCNYTMSSFSGSSIAAPLPACGTLASQDVWFSFVATDSTMSVLLQSVSGLNHGFELYTDSCNGAFVLCQNANGSGSNEYYFNNNFHPGKTYYVRAFNASSILTTVGFGICIQKYPTSANNYCSSAIAITPGTTCNYTMSSFSGSSIAAPLPACGTLASQDVWFSFVATDSTMSVLLQSVSGLNHGFELYTDSCNGAFVLCQNANGSGSNEYYFNNNFHPGKTYYVRAFNASSILTTVGFGICIQKYPTSANNYCGSAVAITPGTTCNYTMSSFSGSSIAAPLPVCGTLASQDVWFSFVATDSTMSVLLQSVSGLNHGFELYTDSCNGAFVLCQNANGSGSNEYYFNNNFHPGKTYYVRAFNASSILTTVGFGICIQKYPSPSNNYCSTALAITPNTTCNYTMSSFSGSSIAAPLPACGTLASQDVWFSFVATDSTMSVLLQSVSGLNHGFELYTDSCNGALVLCQNANGSGSNEYYLNNNFHTGKTYYVRVFNASSILTTADFGICIQKYPSPSNNYCSTALAITPNTICNYTMSSFSGSSIAAPLPACGTLASQDVWFSFVATDPTMTVNLQSVSGINHGFEIIADSCTGSVLHCVNNNGSGSNETVTMTNSIIGKTYFIRVFNVSSVLSVSSFGVCVYGNVTSCVPAINITTSQTNICAGTTVNFTATATNGGTAPVYQWKLNGTNVGTNSNSYNKAGLVSGDIITCVLTSNASCASTTTVISNSITMNVLSTIIPSINITASQTTICAGTSINFTATATNGGTSPVYQWRLNGINVGTNSSNYTHTSLVNGDIVSCVLTSNATCANPTNIASNSITINVSNTVIPFISIAASQTTICSGTSVTFTTFTIHGGTTPIYQWKLNGANVGANSNSYTNTGLVNGDIVSCVLTSNATCANPTNITSNSITMIVSNALTPSINIAASQTTVCPGTTVNFTATPTNGGTAPVYQWKLNGANVGTNNSNYTSASLANGDIITCVLTSNASCASTATVTSNNITMNVLSAVTPSINITASQTTVCASAIVNFTATSTNGGTAPVYQWKLNGVNVGTNSNSYTNSGLVNGDIVTCLLTSNANCANPTNIASNSITMNVLSAVIPSLSITTSQTTVCAGTTVNFTAIPTNGGTAPVYQWKLNGANVGTNSSNYINTSLANGDIITCELTSNASCISTTTATSNSVTMIVDSIVTPTFSIQNSTCKGINIVLPSSSNNNITGTWAPIFDINNTTTYTFTPTVNQCASSITQTIVVNTLPNIAIVFNSPNLIATSGYANYEWKLNSNIIIGQITNTITPTQNGTYQVKVIDANGCSNTAAYELNALGAPEHIISTLNVLPNPTTGIINISNDFLSEHSSINITDLYGRKLMTTPINFQKDITQVNVGHLAKGIYLVHVTDGKTNKYVRIILQ